MKTLNLTQGSPEWIAERLQHFTASEAPMMMNESKYFTRNQLLDHKKGWITSIDEYTQGLFDKGHAAEENARPFADTELKTHHFEKVELLPIVASINIDGLNLLASYDGFCESPLSIWEHKLLNKTLIENVLNGVLEPHHYWQLEHQALVADADEVMFTCSDGTEENSASMMYKSVPERRKELIAGWKQFAKDLANHEIKAKEEKLVANEIAQLPPLEVSLVGNVNSSNLVEYKSTALSFIQSINTNLETDQNFIDAEKAVKWCQKGEKELDAVKERALTDTADIKALFDTIDELKEEMRQKRLKLSKLVKTRKDEIRAEIALKAKTEFSNLLITTSKNLNGIQISQVTVNFDAVMKGKRTVESLQNAVDAEMARVKIDLSTISELVHSNLNSLSELAANHKFLFNDYAQIIFKENDDLVNLINARIAEHEQAETERKANEREQMRLEEERKATEKAEEEQRKAQIIANDKQLKEQEAVKKLHSEQVDLTTEQDTEKSLSDAIATTEHASEGKEATHIQPEQSHPDDCKGCPDCQAIGCDITNQAVKHELANSAPTMFGEYEPLNLWPSDFDISQSDELARVCQKLEEAEAYIQILAADKAA